MKIDLSLFKDLGDVLRAGGEAIAGLINALISAASSSVKAYDQVAARKDRRRLVALSARLTNLGSEFNAPVVRSMDEYLKKKDRTDMDWMVVRRAIKDAVMEVASILDDLKVERSDLVLHPAYAGLSAGLHAREQLLEKLEQMDPPTRPAELKELQAIGKKYAKLILALREAVRALNAYVGEGNLNSMDLTDKEFLRLIT